MEQSVFCEALFWLVYPQNAVISKQPLSHQQGFSVLLSLLIIIIIIFHIFVEALLAALRLGLNWLFHLQQDLIPLFPTKKSTHFSTKPAAAPQQIQTSFFPVPRPPQQSHPNHFKSSSSPHEALFPSCLLRSPEHEIYNKPCQTLHIPLPSLDLRQRLSSNTHRHKVLLLLIS